MVIFVKEDVEYVYIFTLLLHINSNTLTGYHSGVFRIDLIALVYQITTLHWDVIQTKLVSTGIGVLYRCGSLGTKELSAHL